MRVVGRVALVTGAGQGIGHAIAHALAGAEVEVAVNALHRESAERTCRELSDQGVRAIAVPADVADPKAVEQMVRETAASLGPIDILVNNAAASAEPVPFADCSLEEMHRELVTLLGTLYCTRYACPGMIHHQSGRIINISSIAGRHAMPTRAAYSAANAGIESFTRTMAKELGAHGITVNAVSPGATETPRFRNRAEEVRESIAKGIGLHQFAEPEDIAHAVLFLASDQAGYINGAVIDVDGGFSGFPPL